MRHIFALVTLSCLCPALFGQFSGRVTGTVVDATGAVVPNADVRLSLNGGAKALLVTKTSNDGIYHFIGVRPSYYDLTVEAKGFVKTTLRNISVDPAIETSVQTVKLDLASVATTVDVAANAQSVETSNAEVSGVVTMEEVKKLPLIDRDPLSLIQTQPGVVFNGNSDTVINGMRTSYANMTLDGINIQDNYIRDNALDFTPNKLLIGQVRQLTLVTSNQNAAAPDGAAQVAFETPSGGNQFHGEGVWYNRNSAFSANDWFNNQSGINRPRLNQNQMGGSIGGPIKKDKLFFYMNYEAVRNHQQNPSDTIIPTADARNGIFTYVDTSGRVQKINLLNLRRITFDPTMQSVLQQVPTPDKINTFAVGDSSSGLLKNTAGYRFNQRDNEIRDQVTTRGDFNLSTKHVFTGKYIWNRDNLDRPDAENDYSVIPKATNPNESHFVSAAWHWTPTARLTNELLGGFNLTTGDFLNSQQFGSNLITGMFFSDPTNEFMNQGRRTNTYQLSDNAAYQRGRHFIQFGFHMDQVRVRSYFNDGVIPTYVLGMGLGQPALTRNDLPGSRLSDVDVANSLLATYGGYIDSYAQTFNVTSRTSGFVPGANNLRHFLLSEYDFYGQDQWKVSRRLTLTLGMRWDLPTPADERDSLALLPVVQNNNIVQTLLSNATLNFAGRSVGRSWYNRDWHDFAPTVGLAWDVFGNGRTALRAGYSISYVNDQAIVAPENMVEANSGLQFTAADEGLSDRISTGLPKIPVPTFKVPITVAENYDLNPFNTIGFVNPGLRTPYVQQYQFGIQHEIKGNIVEVRYVGNHQVGGFRAFDYNQVQIKPNGFLDDFKRAQANGFLALQQTGTFNPAFNQNIPGSQRLTVFPRLVQGGLLTNATVRTLIETGQTGSLAALYQENALNGGVDFFAQPFALGTDYLTNYTSASYNSLQVQVRRRARAGLDFQANYTFSKVLSDSAGVSQSRIEHFLDLEQPKIERSRAAFDLTHALKGTVTYDLPVGKGHALHARYSWLDRVIGGWSFGSILTWQSGAPISVLSGWGTLNRGDGTRSVGNTANVLVNADALNDVVKFQMTGNGPMIISPSAINPANGSGVADPGSQPFKGQVFFNPPAGTVGTLQKRMFNGPSSFNVDASLLKIVHITERQALELRMEGNNVINHPTFFAGSQNINSLQFGVIGTTFTFQRRMQFGAKYTF
jgi:Carboxypeptidase regulatory-like domain